MTPTKEQIEKAREDLENLQFFLMKNDPRSGIKDPCDKASITRGQIETILSCLTPPEPAASEGEADIPNAFEAYPELSKRIEYLYKNGTGFSLLWWGEFLREINKSLFMASGNNNGAIWVATIRDLSAEVDCLNEKLTALQREFQRKCVLLSKAETMIYRLEADRKLAVEWLGQAQIDAMQAYNAQGTNECGAVLEDSIQSINEALSKLTASKRNNSAEKE